MAAPVPLASSSGGVTTWLAESLAALQLMTTGTRGPSGEILKVGHRGAVFGGTAAGGLGIDGIQAQYTCATVGGGGSTWTGDAVSLPGNLTVGDNLTANDRLTVGTGSEPILDVDHSVGTLKALLLDKLQFFLGGWDSNYGYAFLNAHDEGTDGGIYFRTFDLTDNTATFKFEVVDTLANGVYAAGFLVGTGNKISDITRLHSTIRGRWYYMTGGSLNHGNIIAHDAFNGGAPHDMISLSATGTSIAVAYRGEAGVSYRSRVFLIYVKGVIA